MRYRDRLRFHKSGPSRQPTLRVAEASKCGASAVRAGSRRARRSRANVLWRYSDSGRAMKRGSVGLYCSVHRPVLHHELHPPQRGDVVGGVAIDGCEVGPASPARYPCTARSQPRLWQPSRQRPRSRSGGRRFDSYWSARRARARRSHVSVESWSRRHRLSGCAAASVNASPNSGIFRHFEWLAPPCAPPRGGL
jgi:hypothetical protein